MWRRLFGAVVLMLMLPVGHAQQSANLFATYDFFNKDLKQSAEVLLQIGANEAFSQFSVQAVTNAFTINREERIRGRNLQMDTLGKQYYMSGDSIVFRDFLTINGKLTPVVVSEKRPDYAWQFQADTLVFMGYVCHKATLNFRGRNYVVWYASDLPTPFGPWKFYGLPGLIFRVESEHEQVVFQLKHLSKRPHLIMEPPHLCKKMSFETYVQWSEKAVSDFMEQLKARLPRGATFKLYAIKSFDIEKNYD